MIDIAADVKTTTTKFRGFKGSWALADTQSSAWPLVHEIFAPAPARGPGQPAPVPESVMCTILGFPVNTDNTINDVVIVDETEQALLQDSFDQDMCDVGVARMVCDDGGVEDWEAIRGYYGVCRAAAKRLGTTLDLELGGHPMMAVWYSTEGGSPEGAGV